MIPSLPRGIRLQSDLENIGPEQLQGFFEGWPDAPSAHTLHRMLTASYRVSLAVDTQSGEVAGFIQAISDGILTAFIPLLEVRMEFRGQGTGRALVLHLLAQLEHLYAVDLSCDDALTTFYERLGFMPGRAMIRRRYSRQSGESRRS